MATPYTDIYDFFLSKVEDFSFVDTEKYPTVEDLQAELRKYLRSAIVRFKQSKVDLSKRDELLKQFNEDLNDDEKEILSSLMVLAYIQPKITSVQNMEQRLVDREYKAYSQGKHLQEMISLRKDLQSEVSQLISAYTYEDGLTGLF
jgi:methionine synthase II (cobalamin-independent)